MVWQHKVNVCKKHHHCTQPRHEPASHKPREKWVGADSTFSSRVNSSYVKNGNLVNKNGKENFIRLNNDKLQNLTIAIEWVYGQ